MKLTAIQVMIDDEKLDALRQFTPDGKASIDEELAITVEKLYAKYVPAPVKKYIENRSDGRSKSL